MFDGLPPKRRTATRTGYSILTGHPPVAVQLADQVRSATGMTFGKPRPGGGPAMLHPAFTSARIAEPVKREAERPVPAAEVRDGALLGDRLLAELRRIDAGDLVLPSRSTWREVYGIGYIAALFALRRIGTLNLWMGTAGDRSSIRNEMVMRLKGSPNVLRTPAAPDYIIL